MPSDRHESTDLETGGVFPAPEKAEPAEEAAAGDPEASAVLTSPANWNYPITFDCRNNSVTALRRSVVESCDSEMEAYPGMPKAY